MALTAAGVTAVISAWPPWFDLLRYAGALYLLWLAFQAVAHQSAARLEEKRDASTWSILRMATLNRLLNPVETLANIFESVFNRRANGMMVLAQNTQVRSRQGINIAGHLSLQFHLCSIASVTISIFIM